MNRNKKISGPALLFTVFVLWLGAAGNLQVHAAATEGSSGLTTITVDASDNESGELLYSIDSDAPEDFSTSNEFVVEAGSSHTVYVKDAAGNISSQLINAPVEKVGIEVTLGQDETDSTIGSGSGSFASSGDNVSGSGPAVEAGGGTVNEVTKTVGGSDEKIFYTITTENDNVFYMVIDNTRSADNVYLLNQVTEEDLLALIPGGSARKISRQEAESIQPESEAPETEKKTKEGSGEKSSDLIMIIGVILLIAGGYYYLKVYRPKKAAAVDEADDARDLEEFEAEEENAEEELIFEETDEEREQLLRRITDENNYMDTAQEFSDQEPDPDAEEYYLDKSISEFEKEIEQKPLTGNAVNSDDLNEEGEDDSDEVFV